MHSDEQRWREFLRHCWTSAFGKACAPLKGLALPEDAVRPILVETFRQIGKRFDADSNHGEVAAFVMERAKSEALAHVAEARKLSGDSNRFRVAGSQSYDYGDNPDFAAMCTPNTSGVLNSSELQKLFPALRPIALGTFKKYGISDRDGEEIFSNCLQRLTVPKGDGEGPAMLESLTVFEEVFPFFSKIVQNESVDRIRRVTTLKNQANTQASFDALQDDPDRPIQFADPASLDDSGMPDFNEIYELCSDCLDPGEWKLIATLYMGDKITKKELLEQDDFLEEMGIKPGSHVTRWRGLTKKLEFALGKMRNRLEKNGYYFGNAAA